MNKKYIKPSLVVIQMELHQMLAASKDYKAGDVKLGSGTANNGDAYSRGIDWDDDEDDY